jgi:hypothetical protein
MERLQLSPRSSRACPLLFLMCPPEALIAGPHWPEPQARAIHLGDMEAALSQDCHEDFSAIRPLGGVINSRQGAAAGRERSAGAATLPGRFSSSRAWPSVRYSCRLASIPGLPCVSPPFVFLPDCEASEAHNRTTSLTLGIELEDDLETLPSPLGPLPPRWAR